MTPRAAKEDRERNLLVGHARGSMMPNYRLGLGRVILTTHLLVWQIQGKPYGRFGLGQWLETPVGLLLADIHHVRVTHSSLGGALQFYTDTMVLTLFPVGFPLEMMNARALKRWTSVLTNETDLPVTHVFNDGRFGRTSGPTMALVLLLVSFPLWVLGLMQFDAPPAAYGVVLFAVVAAIVGLMGFVVYRGLRPGPTTDEHLP